MPKYSQDQIDMARFHVGALERTEIIPVEARNPPYEDAHGQSWMLENEALILLSALSTAEQERDESKSKAERYYNDWYVSKAEFGTITAKLRARVRTAEARCAELEALEKALLSAIRYYIEAYGPGYVSTSSDAYAKLTAIIIEGEKA